MDEEEPEIMGGLTLFGLESSEPVKVFLPQCTLGDAVEATRLQDARSRFENSLKVKPVNSIVTDNGFSALNSFNPQWLMRRRLMWRRPRRECQKRRKM